MQANVLLACNAIHASKKGHRATRITRVIMFSMGCGRQGEKERVFDISTTLGTLAVNQYLA